MTFWTMMMVDLHDMTAEAGAQAWIDRRCIEEAAETILGFQHGEALVSTDKPSRICVMCGWDDEAAYDAWVKSPVRDKQLADLAPVISAEVTTLPFQSVHVVPGPWPRSGRHPRPLPTGS